MYLSKTSDNPYSCNQCGGKILRVRSQCFPPGCAHCFCGKACESEFKRQSNKGSGNGNYRHGGKGTRIYNTWKGMKQRCHNPKNKKAWGWYGSRGISVCDEWRKSFEKFRDWSLAHGYSDGLQIDRINNDGNYEPSNCRWVTNAENSKNKTTTRLTQAIIKKIEALKGLGMPVSEISYRLGIGRSTVYRGFRNPKTPSRTTSART